MHYFVGLSACCAPTLSVIRCKPFYLPCSCSNFEVNWLFDCVGADLLALAFDDSATSKVQLSSQSEGKKISICSIARHTSCKGTYKSANHDHTALQCGSITKVVSVSMRKACATFLISFLCVVSHKNECAKTPFVHRGVCVFLGVLELLPSHTWKGHTPDMCNAFMVRRRNSGTLRGRLVAKT